MNIDLSPKANEIVQHTKKLLEVGGYKSFSFADISKLANIRKASIYHHFSSKAELVQVVVKSHRLSAMEALNMLEKKNLGPLENLNAYIAHWANCISERTSSFCICAMLAFEITSLPDEVAEEVRQHFHDLTCWITNQIHKGVETQVFCLRDTPEVEAKAFMANLYGAMLAVRGFGNESCFLEIMQANMKKLY